MSHELGDLNTNVHLRQKNQFNAQSFDRDPSQFLFEMIVHISVTEFQADISNICSSYTANPVYYYTVVFFF